MSEDYIGYPLENDPDWLAEKAIDRIWDLAGEKVDMVEAFETLIEYAQSAIQTHKDTQEWEDVRSE